MNDITTKCYELNIAPPALIENQERRASQQQQHRRPDPAADRLPVQAPGKHGRKQCFQRQHQGSACSAGSLQSPRKRDWTNTGADERHRHYAREVTSSKLGLMRDLPTRACTEECRARVEERRRRECPYACSEALDERRADPKKYRCQQGKQSSAQRWQGRDWHGE
jgi:hypothetical protein